MHLMTDGFFPSPQEVYKIQFENSQVIMQS